MTGTHEEKKEKTRSKVSFANVVVAVCVAVALVITAAVVWEYHRLGVVMPTGVLTTLFGFWGGELLIVALRQIFGSDAVAKVTAAKSSYDTYGGGSI